MNQKKRGKKMQKVKTYRDVCADFNPFSGITTVDRFGGSAELYHNYMLSYFGGTPVKPDTAELNRQIALVFALNDAKYSMLYRAQLIGADLSFDPRVEFNYSDTTTKTGQDSTAHTGTISDVKTGSVSDSGTDITSSSNTVTDRATTYDSTTENETGQSSSSGSGSVTHGLTTTYNGVTNTRTLGNTDTTTHGTTNDRTVIGFKQSPIKSLENYMEFAHRNFVFEEIINDVLRAISHIIYIPEIPEEMEE